MRPFPKVDNVLPNTVGGPAKSGHQRQSPRQSKERVMTATTRTRSKSKLLLFVLMGLFSLSAYWLANLTLTTTDTTPSTSGITFLMLSGFVLLGLGIFGVRK